MALLNMPTFIIVLLLALTGGEAAKLYAWGVNDYGQLGINGTTIRFPQLIPAYNNLDIVALKASGTFHMAFASNGDVYVCGNNWYGGLGLSISTGIFVATPRLNPALKNCNVYLGKRHGNAVCGNRFVGWGVQSGYVRGITSGNYGNISDSLPSYQMGSNVANVTAGVTFSLVTFNNGTKVIAGGGGGILGLGDAQGRPFFVKWTAFDGIPLMKVFPSHADHACGITDTYSLYCWGSNTVGQLGLGDTTNRTSPQLVTFFEQDHYVAQVATGEYHTLALTAGGRVFAWGLGTNGVLGNGAFDNSTFSTPIEVKELADKNIIEVVAGLNFNFARTSSNKWYSWGAGYGGVLGTLKDEDINKPTLVTFLSSFNINHILTASSSRSVYGWLDPGAPTSIAGPPLVNECITDPSNTVCSTNAHCQDTDRSWTCACDNGYAGPDANHCQDIDECVDPSAVCVANSTCTNTPGSFNCTCPANRPVGDGTLAGTGCAPLPTPPPTPPPTQAPTLPPTLPPTQPPSNSSGSDSSSDDNSTTSLPGLTTSSSNSSADSSSSQSTAAANGGSGSSTTTGGSSTDPSSGPSSGSQSTTFRTNSYQTLGGALDQIQKPAESEGSSDDALLLGNRGSKNNDRDIMIGVLIGFCVLIAIVVVVGAIVIFRARRPVRY